MKKIKFRGKSLDNGKMFYGYLWHSETFGATVNGVVVDPESVAQLIGYDKNGKEIYSDDEVDVDSEIPYWIPACWAEYEQIGDTFENWTLREATDNGVE